MRLRAAEPAVRTDLILERAHLFEIGVVAAVDHQVGDCRVAVDLGDLIPRPWPEWFQRILTLHVAGSQIESAVPAEHHRRAGLLSHQYEPDLRVGAQTRDELRISPVDLLACQAPIRS